MIRKIYSNKFGKTTREYTITYKLFCLTIIKKVCYQDIKTNIWNRTVSVFGVVVYRVDKLKLVKI